MYNSNKFHTKGAGSILACEIFIYRNLTYINILSVTDILVLGNIKHLFLLNIEYIYLYFTYYMINFNENLVLGWFFENISNYLFE